MFYTENEIVGGDEFFKKYGKTLHFRDGFKSVYFLDENNNSIEKNLNKISDFVNYRYYQGLDAEAKELRTAIRGSKEWKTTFPTELRKRCQNKCEITGIEFNSEEIKNIWLSVNPKFPLVGLRLGMHKHHINPSKYSDLDLDNFIAVCSAAHLIILHRSYLTILIPELLKDMKLLFTFAALIPFEKDDDHPEEWKWWQQFQSISEQLDDEIPY
jgi:hypothetical protein